ncbi:hypothetical protein CYMTET_7149 [Cymbomonas tetramitiformis]|uniref:Uncharacterized protein n=1 Tax=Cymbomonas tetramitiformis TaxID=36881 RepID=A0AAE0GVK1_9CHLO|nr:hypothetical protein CYMTET_7149 [Cymbomonas tetramitiformis]
MLRCEERRETGGTASGGVETRQRTRDNHLGNTLNGETPRFNWTVPEFAVGEQCALRLRYNISTGDYDGWDPNVNSTLNDLDGKKLNLAASLGYEADFQNNPEVDFGLGVEFELAVNTAQFGRTFQDRSHRVAFRNLPEGLEHAKAQFERACHRGNIVQVYPSVEYDFTPNTLSVSTADLVHIQWTGSNTNPRNNDGQGLAGTDRSNIVPIEDMLNNVPDRFDESPSWFKDVEAQVHGIGDATESSLGPMSGSDLAHFLSLASPTQMGGELSELDDMSPHYNGGLVRLFSKGQYRYMCSRNNNFSNRSQKGKLIANVIESAASYGGEIWTSSTGAGLKVPEGRKYQQKGQSTWQSALSIEIMELGNESSAGEAPAVAPENVENPGAVPGDVQAVQGIGKAFGFLPHGTTFSDNVTLMLTYTEEELQALRDDSDGKHQLLAFARTDDTEDSTWEVLEGGDFADGTASIDITGFSVYSLVIVTYTKKNGLDGYAVAMLVVGVVLLMSAALLALAIYRGKSAHENLPEDEQELLFRSPKKSQSNSFTVASLLQSVTGKKPDPPAQPSRMTPALSAANKLRAASIGDDSSLREAAAATAAQKDHPEAGSVL